MGNQALKLTLKKNRKDLIFAGALIASITLSGIGLFGSGKTSFAFGITGMVLLILLFLFAAVDAIHCIDRMRNEADIRKRDIVGNIFPSVTILGGAVLTGMSFLGRLDGNARFVVGMVGFTLLLSSLLCFVAHRAEFIRDEYKLQNSINGSFENVSSESGCENRIDSGVETPAC